MSIKNFGLLYDNLFGARLGLSRSVGGGGVEPAVDLSDNFTDDFTGQIVSTPLYTRSGWAAFNSIGATDANRDRLFVQDEKVGHTGTTGGNNYLVGQNFGAAAQVGGYIRLTLTTALSTSLAAVVGSVDEINCIGFKISSAGVYQLFKRVAGVETTVALAGAVFAVGDVVEVWGTNLGSTTPRLTVYKNGAPLLNGTAVIANAINYNINTSGSAAVIGGKSGVLTGSGSNQARFDNYYSSTVAGSVTVTHTALFYPSDFNNLGASPSDYTGHDVPITGAYGTTAGQTVPTALQFRIIDELNFSTVYQGWTDVSGFSAAAGTWSGTARVLPTPQTGRIEVRFRNDISIRNYAQTTIACGPAAVGYGQSNAAFSLQVGTADTSINTYRSRNTYSFDRTLSIVTANSWKRNDNSFSSQVMARIISDAFGLTAGVCGGGIGSQPATALRKTAPTQTFADPYNGNALTAPYVMLNNHIVAARANGRIMSIFYDQGEAEGAQTGSDSDMTAYTTDVSSIFADMRTDFGGGRNVLGLMTMTGRGDGAADAQANTNYSAVRATQKAMTSSIPNCVVGQHNVGVLMSDADHYASVENGKTEKHRRNGRSIVNALLGTGYKGSGPQTLTGTRSGAVITLPITANGATSYSALSGLDGTTAGSASALTSWQVSADDFATTLTITSVTLTGTDVVITLAATPGGAVKVRNHYGKNPTITSWVFGTYSDGFKIAVEPLVTPITVS